LALNSDTKGEYCLKQIIIILIHSFIGWAFCAAIMGIGPQLIGMKTTLVVHLILGPIGFGFLSAFYHKKFGYTRPIVTAAIFLFFVAGMDFFLVGLVVLKSLEMFTSVIGIWLPFILIFMFSFGGGALMKRDKLNK
jgi:hypothetical protein